MSGIAPKQNAFKFKIAPHKQKSTAKLFWQEDEAPLANEALCLSTPKHNGKSGTGDLLFRCVFYGRLDCLYISSSFYQLVHLKGSEFQMLKNAKCSSSVQNFRCKKFRQVFFSWRARPMRVCNIRCP